MRESRFLRRKILLCDAVKKNSLIVSIDFPNFRKMREIFMYQKRNIVCTVEKKIAPVFNGLGTALVSR